MAEAAQAGAVRQASVYDAPLLAAIHGACFTEGWTGETFVTLLLQPGVIAWLWEDRLGFLIVRAAADEAEILTLAVMPAARRRGGARTLVAEALRALGKGATRRLFLEVAADNAPAKALYAVAGFTIVGKRPDYYGAGAKRTDAMIMALSIPAP